MKKTHKKTYEELKKENETLRDAAIAFHWMARRYADGRMTYAAHIVNDHTYKLLKMGVCLDINIDIAGNDTFFAHDGQENLEKNCFCIPKHYLDLERKILERKNS